MSKDNFENTNINVACVQANSTRSFGGLVAEEVAGDNQLVMDYGIEIEKSVNGIEMGVLQNGISYLTQSGLSFICGVDRKTIFNISKEWEENFHERIILEKDDRKSFIQEYLFKNDYREELLYLPIKKGNLMYYAYPDIVCMAVLEYYAFESKKKSQFAQNNYRKFAKLGLQEFIYKTLGYSPGDPWKYYIERVSVLKDSVPFGYFSIFNETSSLIVDLITSGLTINDKTIPDSSVGITWGHYWKENNLSDKYGDRVPYSHDYPDLYPQSASNPQAAWAYPNTSLPEFREWFIEIYLLLKFPPYILKKSSSLPGGKKEAQQLAQAFKNKSALMQSSRLAIAK